MLRIYFLDVGQGESTLLILPDGTNMLIDTGSPAAAPMLVDNLMYLGINRIDHLILTHPHDDHIGGIFNVLHEMEVVNMYDNSFDNFKSNLFWDYVRVVRNDPARYQFLRAGDSLVVGDIEIRVLNPIIPPTGNINEDSIVLRVSYGDIGILLTGDVRSMGEKRILESDHTVKSNILKIGHHGDTGASSENFLNTVAPEVAVISAGADNKYVKPHGDALSRIHASGADVFRTDVHGHIIVETDGTTYAVRTRRNFLHSEKKTGGNN
ncbi:MAG: MBL fold metallo-hydrolase [Nitrospiraceae bacterium]|nr:MAG: MBL fold metallo-hydrolase [Nitrospiraceae bacterium]